MAARPYWSGQIKISLVAFGVQLFPATNSQSGVTFHQIHRASGKRIHHRNVIGDNRPIENSEIVKGYEVSKGKYLIVEPDEIAKLRIETKNTIDVQQFVTLDELPPELFEKPYFVIPEPKESPDTYAVIHRAMEQSGKVAIGEMAFGGREHLVAIAVPRSRSSAGLIAYTLRYGEELRNSDEYFSGIASASGSKIDKKQLAMATQLIDAYSHPLDLDAYKDDYESALRELIEAKQKNARLPVDEKRAKPAKVVSLMDALEQSISRAKRPPARERHATAARKGPVLVESGKSAGGKRKHRAA